VRVIVRERVRERERERERESPHPDTEFFLAVIHRRFEILEIYFLLNFNFNFNLEVFPKK
jgi:hypothetical protein